MSDCVCDSIPQLSVCTSLTFTIFGSSSSCIYRLVIGLSVQTTRYDFSDKLNSTDQKISGILILRLPHLHSWSAFLALHLPDVSSRFLPPLPSTPLLLLRRCLPTSLPLHQLSLLLRAKRIRFLPFTTQLRLSFPFSPFTFFIRSFIRHPQGMCLLAPVSMAARAASSSRASGSLPSATAAHLTVTRLVVSFFSRFSPRFFLLHSNSCHNHVPTSVFFPEIGFFRFF